MYIKVKSSISEYNTIKTKNLMTGWDEESEKYSFYTTYSMILNENWYDNYINFQEGKKYHIDTLFNKFCIYDNLIYGAIIKNYTNKMPVMKSNKLNELEIALKEILNDNFFLLGYSSVKLFKNDDVKLKLIIKMMKLKLITVYKDLDNDCLNIVITRKMIEALDKGFDGFRFIVIKGLNDKRINKLNGLLSNRIEEYLPCKVNDNNTLVVIKHPFK